MLNCVDGCIPSDLATGTPAEIEEERRLLYVAMTRAKDALHLMTPLRFHVHGQAARATSTSTRRAAASCRRTCSTGSRRSPGRRAWRGERAGARPVAPRDLKLKVRGMWAVNCLPAFSLATAHVPRVRRAESAL